MKNLTKYITAAASALTLTSCGLDPVSPLPSQQLVLLGLLGADSPIDSIRVTRTMPPDNYYAGIEQDYVTGALVTLTRDGVADTLPEVAPGYYGDGVIVAEPGATYRIDVWEGGSHLYSETTVPRRISVSRVVNYADSPYIITPDTLLFPFEYADPDYFADDVDIPQKPLSIEWMDVEGAAGYEFAAIALDTSGVNFLRKSSYEDWLDGDYRTAESREWQRMTRYPAFEGETSTDLLWAALNYRSDYNVVIFARDRNYDDFVLTVEEFNSGNDYDTGTVMYVEGGLGLFGSYSSDTLSLHVRAEWLPSENL